MRGRICEFADPPFVCPEFGFSNHPKSCHPPDEHFPLDLRQLPRQSSPLPDELLHPENPSLKTYHRGISGNKVPDLDAWSGAGGSALDDNPLEIGDGNAVLAAVILQEPSGIGFAITGIDYSPDTDSVTLTLTSRPGATYAVEASPDSQN